MRFEYIHTHAIASEVAMHRCVLAVTQRGYAKYLKAQVRPCKYAALPASMKAILAEDEFKRNYGKRRMFEKLRLDYDCPYSYNTVAKVMRGTG